jgi:hypothetical protein
VANRIDERRQFQRESFLTRATAEIIVHGEHNTGLPFENGVLQKFQRR